MFVLSLQRQETGLGQETDESPRLPMSRDRTQRRWKDHFVSGHFGKIETGQLIKSLTEESHYYWFWRFFEK